jgi:hypothetical protein
MKNFLPLFLLLLTCNLRAQYYYNDIVGTNETNSRMKSYIDNRVRTVTASGVDQNGMRANDFTEYHEVRDNGRGLKSSTIVNLNKSVTYSRFDEKGRIISMSDSSSEVSSVTNYSYDANGRIASITNVVSDPGNDFNQQEAHQWLYDANGKPAKMWRIITNRSAGQQTVDSLEVRFVLDEDGNPGEEHTYKRGYQTGYLYYYYDDKDRLSDVVRYNTIAKKLLPDLMFEYDDKGRVAQKITTTTNLHLKYLKWRYIYNEKGLKTKEAMFESSDTQMTGRIDYAYTFN